MTRSRPRYEDEDDDRPRRRPIKRRKKAATSNAPLFAALGGGAVLLLVVVGVVLGLRGGKSNPKAGGGTTPDNGQAAAAPPLTADEAWQRLLGSWTRVTSVPQAGSTTTSRFRFTADRKMHYGGQISGGPLGGTTIPDIPYTVTGVAVRDGVIVVRTATPNNLGSPRTPDVVEIELLGDNQFRIGDGDPYTRDG